MASQPEIPTLALTLYVDKSILVVAVCAYFTLSSRALALPPVIILAIWWGIKKASQPKAYDPKTGLGKGAPGFTTNVRRVAVPPEIMARIRAGEQVSGEEITAAQDKMRREEEEKEKREASGISEEPETATKKKKKGSKRR